MTPEALAALYQLRLEGLSTATARAILGDVEATLEAIAGRLATRTVGTFSYDRYAALQQQLVTLRLALRQKLPTILTEGIDAVIATTRVAVGQEIAVANVPGLSFSFALLPVEQMLAIKDIPHDGFSWTRWGQRMGDEVLNRVESELRQSLSLGEAVRDVSKRLERVGELSRVSATRLARTALTASSNRARMAQYQSDDARRFSDGWRFSAVLDGRVTATCASLHGKVFATDDVNAPVPPRHPNCRSIMMLVWKDGAGRFTRDWYEKNAQSGEDWLRSLPEETQREILGATRWRTWQKGVQLSDTITYDKPLSAAELRRLYPEQAA